MHVFRSPAADRVRRGTEGARRPTAWANRHGAEGVPRRAARVPRPPPRAGRLPPPSAASMWTDPKKPCASNCPSLVAPHARAGRPRRPQRPLRTAPAHIRDRAAPRRRHRGRLAGARPRRPEYDARHLRPPRRNRSRGSRWMPTHVDSSTNGRTESLARLSQKMEAAGIEPASAVAPSRASTSVACGLFSPGGRFAGDLPTGQPILRSRPSGDQRSFGASPFSDAATRTTGRIRSDASPN